VSDDEILKAVRLALARRMYVGQDGQEAVNATEILAEIRALVAELPS
jgi:hypothetical protein